MTATELVWGTTRFVTGDHDALAGPTTFGIVERGNPDTRAKLWKLVASEATLDEVLDELSVGGLRSLPSFAIGQYEADVVRLVVRGAACARVRTRDGSTRTIDAAEIRTWTEELVPAAASVELWIGDSIDVEGDFHVLAGIVPARAISRTVTTDDPMADIARGSWSRDLGEPRLDPIAADATIPDPEPLPATDTGVASTPSPSTPPPGAAAPDPPTAQPVDEPEEQVADDEPAPAEVAAPGNPFSLLSPTGWPATSGPDAPASPAAAEIPETSRANPAPVPTAPGVGDEDSPTEPRPTTTTPAGQVMARFCSAGHPNPPHASVCRVCTSPIVSDDPTPIARPVLGTLVFSDGARVPLDRTVVMGRNPKVTEAPGGQIPRIHKLTSALNELSRSHAQVRVEGWELLLEDLGSRNGTEVSLPGRARRPVGPGEQVAMPIGSVIHFDDELSATIEPPE